MTTEKISNEIFISSDTKRAEAIKKLSEIDLNTHKVKFIKVRDARTILQNAALHKYLELLANALNDAGYEMKRVLSRKPEVEVPWDMLKIKEFMWKPLQKAVIDKESTTEANKLEYSEVYKILDRYTSENFGVHVEFPSRESLK